MKQTFYATDYSPSLIYLWSVNIKTTTHYYYLSYSNTAMTCNPDDDNSDQDEWLWNTPLAALPVFLKTDNAVMSLKNLPRKL